MADTTTTTTTTLSPSSNWGFNLQESNAPSGGTVSIPALGWYTIQFIAYTTEDNTPLYMSLSTRDISDLTYDNLIYVTNTPITYQWKINYQDDDFSVKDNILKFWHSTENASVVLKNIQIQLGNVSVQFPTSSGSGSGGSGGGSGSGSGNGDGSGNGGGYDSFGTHVTMGQNSPDNPNVGDIWYVTDETGKVIDIRTWDGSKWISYLDVDSLNKAIDEANQAAKEAEEVGKHAEEVANEVNERVDQAAQETQEAIDQAQDAVDRANAASQQAGTAIDNAQDALDQIDAANVRIDSAISNAEHAIDVSQAAQTEAEAAQSTANNAASQANDALTNAQKAWDEAQTKADADGVYTKEEMDATLLGYASKTTVNILTGRVDQAETNITQNANKIDLKADQSTVNELTGQVSTVESEISQQADEISARITKQEADSLYATQSQLTQTSDSLTSSITKVQTNLDGLEVGTTNLYQQSGFVKLNVSNFSIDQSDPTGYIYSFTIPANTTPTWTSGIQYNFKNVLLSPGKYYTYSWDTYSDADGIPIYFDPNNYDNPDFTGDNDNDDRNKRQFNCPTTIANKWVHCIVTIYMPASLTQDYYDGSTICLQKGWKNGSSDVNIKIRHVKVEQGNKATDWSLSPADTATIVQFSQLQQTVDGINTIVSKKLDQTDFNSYTAQTADTIATLITKTDASNTYATKSALSQTADSLSTEIQTSENDSKSYTDSQITQTSSSLTSKISQAVGDIQIGDRNLLLNSNFYNGSGTHWSISDSSKTSIYAFNNLTNAWYLQTTIPSGNTSQKDVTQVIDRIQPSTEYTLSVILGGANIQLYVVELKSDHSNTASYQDHKHTYNISDMSLTESSRISFTFKTQSDCGSVRVYFRTIGSSSATVTARAAFFKFERGNKATDWSPAPEDNIEQFSQLTQTVNGISTQVSNKVDKSTYNSYTAQTADTIATLITKTDASNTYATKSALSQTSSSLSTEIQQSENDAKSYADSRVTQTANSLQTTITAIKNKDKEKCIDPSFENGLISIFGDAFMAVGSDNGNYHSGTKSIRASGQSNTSYICNFPVYPGMKIRLSWWVRTTDDFTCATDNTKIRIMLNGVHWVEADLLWTKGVKTDWTYDEKVVTIPDQPTSGQMFFTATVNTMVQSGVMKIDDVSIMDVTDEQQVQSQISQLSDDINLRVKKGDTITQINIDGASSTVLIDGKYVHITGQTSIDNAVIKDAMIANLSASKITTGTLDASKATITNINASNISTGTLNAARIAANSIDANKLNVSTLSAITANLGNVNAGNISGVDINIGGKFHVDSSGNLTASDGTYTGDMSLNGQFHLPYMDSDDTDIVDSYNQLYGIKGTFRYKENPNAYSAREIWGESFLGGVFNSYHAKIRVQKDNNIYYAASYYGASGIKMRAFLNSSNNDYTGTFSGVNNRIDILPNKITLGTSGDNGSPDWNDNIIISSNGDISADGNISPNNMQIGYHTFRSKDGGNIGFRDGDTGYSGIDALYFHEQSAYILKQDFAMANTENCLATINAADIVRFRYKADVKNGIDDIYTGFVIGGGFKTPKDFISSDGHSLLSYSVTGNLVGSVQELTKLRKQDQVRMTNSELKINDLQSKITYLEQKFNELKQQINQ